MLEGDVPVCGLSQLGSAQNLIERVHTLQWRVAGNELLDECHPGAIPTPGHALPGVSREQSGFSSHVYPHHLNALFGYAPLMIRESNLRRF